MSQISDNIDKSPNNLNVLFNSNHNIINNNKDDDNQSDIKLYNIERWETKLSLRKKKINEKLLYRRKIEEQNYENRPINFGKIILLNESFDNLISKISIEYKNEEKLILILSQICYIIEHKTRENKTEIAHNIYNFSAKNLIDNYLAENLYTLTKMYLKSEKVLYYITRILLFSCLLISKDSNDINESTINNFLYNENQKFNKRGYFISTDKYIDVYNKILEMHLKEDSQIVYNMIIFIGSIAKDEKNNQLALYASGTLNYLVESIDIERDSKKLLSEKIWCLSKFDIEEKYDINLELSLKIQKIYVEIFLNQNKFELFESINQEINENNFLYNYLKVIENTSYCLQDIYIENMIKSSILEFLMDKFLNKNDILIEIIVDTFINLSNASTELSRRLINIGVIKFLVNVLIDKTVDMRLRESTFLPINNFLQDSQLFNKVLFEQNVLKTYCILLNEENISSYAFKEICYGFYIVIPFCENDLLNKLIEKYYIIQLLCKKADQIFSIEKNNLNDASFLFLNTILSFLNNNDNELIDKIKIKFLSVGGEEILDRIINIYSNINIEYKDENEKEDIKKIINFADDLKASIKNL